LIFGVIHFHPDLIKGTSVQLIIAIWAGFTLLYSFRQVTFDSEFGCRLFYFLYFLHFPGLFVNFVYLLGYQMASLKIKISTLKSIEETKNVSSLLLMLILRSCFFSNGSIRHNLLL